MSDIPGGVNTTATLNFGTAILDRLEVTGDSDWYRVTLSAGVLYGFALTGRSVGGSAAAADPLLRIFDRDGVQVAENDDGGFDRGSLLEFYPGRTGTYFIAAGSYQGQSVGGYELLGARIDPEDDLPNNTGTTRELSVGAPVDARIDFRGDADAVRVQLTAGVTYIFDALGAGAGGGFTLSDSYLLIIDGLVSVPLVEADGGGAGRDARLIFTPNTSRTYFLGASADALGTGTYRLTMQVAPDPPRERDGNPARNETINGGSGNDTLRGDASGRDRLNGRDGDDRLVVGNSQDTLVGGAGDDTYVLRMFAILVDYIEVAGEGDDRIESEYSLYLPEHFERLTLLDTSLAEFAVGNDTDNLLTGNARANLLLGGNGDDTINGGGAGDQLFGQTGDDSLLGDAGIDYLVGGTGNDSLDGGADPDALYGEDGADTLIGGASFHTDILVGGDGADSLDGRSGAGDYDIMNGGDGDDTYRVDTFADLTFEAAGGGVDTVIADIAGTGYYLYAHVDHLILEGATPFGVGNDLNNRLTGNAQGNYLLGGAGDDTLDGAAGGDVLFGQAGRDTFAFTRGTGGDVIGDFAPGTDRIRLTGLGFTSFAQVQANLVENGGTTAINLGGGDFVVLNGVARTTLTAAEFLFG